MDLVIAGSHQWLKASLSLTRYAVLLIRLPICNQCILGPVQFKHMSLNCYSWCLANACLNADNLHVLHNSLATP